MFLAHWPIAVLTIQVGWAEHKGGWLLLTAMVPTLVFALLIHYWVEVPVEVLRRRIRSASK